VLLVGAAALAGLLAGVGLMLAANRRSRLPGPQSSEPAPEA
jgi:hypothetical protein